MTKRILILLYLIFFGTFSGLATLTENEDVIFKGTFTATNNACYILWTCPWDTNSYFGWTSATQMMMRFQGTNTYFNLNAEEIIFSPWTGNVDANGYGLTDASTVTMDLTGRLMSISRTFCAPDITSP